MQVPSPLPAAPPPGPRTAAPGGRAGNENGSGSTASPPPGTGTGKPWRCPGCAGSPLTADLPRTPCLPSPRCLLPRSEPTRGPRGGGGSTRVPPGTAAMWVGVGGRGAPRGAEPLALPPSSGESSGFACRKGRDSARFEVFCPNCCFQGQLSSTEIWGRPQHTPSCPLPLLPGPSPGIAGCLWGRDQRGRALHGGVGVGCFSWGGGLLIPAPGTR